MSVTDGADGVTGDQAHASAFAIQVELSTRVGLRPLSRSEGVLSEALASLHSLFGTVRAAVQDWNRRGDQNEQTLRIAEELLNGVLRPFLDRWYPLLRAYEDAAEPGEALVDREARWEHAEQFRQDLDALSEPLTRINRELAEITGADLEPPLPSTNRSED